MIVYVAVTHGQHDSQTAHKLVFDKPLLPVETPLLLATCEGFFSLEHQQQQQQNTLRICDQSATRNSRQTRACTMEFRAALDSTRTKSMINKASGTFRKSTIDPMKAVKKPGKKQN